MCVPCDSSECVFCLPAVEHPMDDYYRKLFKSLHKNKEEMLRLMEEQSLFQLSQVGLKVCATTSLRNRQHQY